MVFASLAPKENSLWKGNTCTTRIKQQTRVERTNAQHPTASYHGRPANRNTQSYSNTLKTDPFKTLFSRPFQHLYLYVSLANKTYTSAAGSLSAAFTSLLTRAFNSLSWTQNKRPFALFGDDFFLTIMTKSYEVLLQCQNCLPMTKI